MTVETYDDLKQYVGSKDDFTDDLLNMGYNIGIVKGYNQALEDLFNKCKEKYPKNYAGEDSCLKCAEKLLAEYEKQVVSDFAYWLTQKIDLRFSNNSSVWVDEYFNHTIEKLAEQLKGE